MYINFYYKIHNLGESNLSSKAIERKFVRIECEEEERFDIKHISIPFSSFFRKEQKFIYDGSEKMPFIIRESLFKTILLQEFSDNE